MTKGFKDRLGLYTDRLTGVDPASYFKTFKKKLEEVSSIDYAGLDRNKRFMNLFSNPRFMGLVFRQVYFSWKLFHHRVDFPSLLITTTMIVYDHFNETRLFETLVNLYRESCRKFEEAGIRAASLMLESRLLKAAEESEAGFLFKCLVDTKGSRYHVLNLSEASDFLWEII